MAIKLTELNPRWYVLDEGGPRCGLTFDCPHCRAQRLGITFHHSGHEAFDDATIHVRHPTEKIWTLAGQDDFGTLSLTPSIDASGVGHWHGYITSGEIR